MRMVCLRLAIVAATVLASGVSTMASSPPGASSCSGCHAANTTAIPGIVGRDANDTMAAMTAFRDGLRPATVMNRIAKGFSDDELRAIAAWLAIQK